MAVLMADVIRPEESTVNAPTFAYDPYWPEMTPVTGKTLFDRVPVRFEAVRFERPDALPVYKFADTDPLTFKKSKTPSCVMLDWIGAVTEKAVWIGPYTFEALMYVIPAPLPDTDPTATAPDTVRLVSVPRLVIFGWAFAVTDPAAAILPITFAALMFEIPEPFETTKRPLTTRPVRVPTLVMFGWA